MPRSRAILGRWRRSLLARLTAVVLLLSAVPGADELALDLVHLALHGHVSDASGHERMDADDDCCSGLFHLCACHHLVAGLGSDAFVRVPFAAAGQRIHVDDPAVLRLRGYRAQLYRPPST